MVTPRVAIVTAIYDGYDTLKPVLPQTGADVDWVLVTDDASFGSSSLGWRVVHQSRPGDLHPNRAAKRPKFRPWDYTDAPVSIWLDASFRVVSETFASDMADLADPIAQFVHPWRNCVYDEAVASAGIPKYAGEDFELQVKTVRTRFSHPEHWGLWATGLIVRSHDSRRVRELAEDWSFLVNCGTFQDQVSQPVALRWNSLRPTALPGTHLANQWVAYEGSERH